MHHIFLNLNCASLIKKVYFVYFCKEVQEEASEEPEATESPRTVEDQVSDSPSNILTITSNQAVLA